MLSNGENAQPRPPISGRLGIGCAYISAGSLTQYDARLIQAAFDAGARHFDVAPSYGLGYAEYVLGRALGHNRKHVSITTKVGIPRPNVHPAKIVLRGLAAPVRHFLRANKSAASWLIKGRQSHNYGVDFVRSSFEQSLRALKTDYVDVLLLHAPQRGDITDELLLALDKLRQSGKAVALGIATSRAETDAILANYPRVFDVVQHEWSILDPPLLHPVLNDPYRVTHRALARALLPLRHWLAFEKPRLKTISDAMNCDMENSQNLSRSLIGAAMAENPCGTVLVASRNIERTRLNVQWSTEPKTLEDGKKLISLMRNFDDLPKVLD